MKKNNYDRRGYIGDSHGTNLSCKGVIEGYNILRKFLDKTLRLRGPGGRGKGFGVTFENNAKTGWKHCVRKFETPGIYAQ